MMNKFTKYKLSILSCLALMFVGNAVIAQDLHFTQFMNNPLLTNPANTGFNPDNDYRIGVSYRNQWQSFPVPYKTMAAWGDVQIMRDAIQNGWFGVGGVILRDEAGDGGLKSTKVYGSVAYHQELGLGSLLSFGVNLGYASKTVDFLKFKWENQWNGKFFDSDAAIGENFAYSRIGYLDIQAGLNYAYFANDRLYLNAGASIMHVNQPRESFFQNSANTVPFRYTGFANASFKINDYWIVSPNAYYSQQAKASEFVAGAMAQYNLSGDGDLQLIGGAYYRVGDAAAGMIGIEWNKIRVSFTYDATVSSVRNYVPGGAMEFSMIKFGSFNTGVPRNMRCPTF